MNALEDEAVHVMREVAADFDEVYRSMVDALVAAATEHGEVLYAVPGSPRVAERSVRLLAADDRVGTEVVPALSFLDLAWVRLGVDPLERGVRVVDGRSFATDAAGSTGPLLVAQCDARHVLSEIKLAIEKIFNVQVASVNTMNKIGKTRRTKFGLGKRKDTKRAIVTLKSGTIVIFTAVG